jgi:hypothetical protein
MDPTSAVRTDAVPVLATVIAPGAVLSTPYLWALLASTPPLAGYLDRHEAIAITSAMLIWIVAGFAVESIGSYVEVYGIDRPRRDHAQMLENWWRYLRVAWNREPIGQHYLRRLLVSFKFELNMCVAAAGSAPGVLALGVMGRIREFTAACIIVVLVVAAAALFRAATDTAVVLADVRSRLILGVGEPAFDTNGEIGTGA